MSFDYQIYHVHALLVAQYQNAWGDYALSKALVLLGKIETQNEISAKNIIYKNLFNFLG